MRLAILEYTYIGYTKDRRIVKGQTSADTETAAINGLARIGYQVVSISLVKSFLPDLGNFLKGTVKASELAMFSRQLALLLESGLGIIQGLELLQSQTEEKELKKVLIEVIADLRGGDPLSISLARHPHVFSTMYQKMVAVGEETGGVELVLRGLASYIERESATRGKLKSAMTYPAIVAVVALLVMIVMVTVVLPPLVGMFTSLKGELPILTRILLGFVDIVRDYGLYILMILLVLGFAGYIYTRTPKGRYYRDLVVLRLPLMGRLILISDLARCCRSISVLFKAGLPLPDIMTLVAQSSGNQVIARAFNSVEQDMLKGEGLSMPMRKWKVFLPLMVEMTKVGETTGTLDTTLLTVAENYEIEAENKTQRIVSMIEPIMTVAMGIVVAFLALSIFMPLYSSLSLIK
jgi:type IV pilus assembly protein PilC